MVIVSVDNVDRILTILQQYSPRSDLGFPLEFRTQSEVLGKLRSFSGVHRDRKYCLESYQNFREKSIFISNDSID